MSGSNMRQGYSSQPTTPRSQLQYTDLLILYSTYNSFPNLQKQIGSNLFRLPHPFSRGIDLAFKMQQLLIDGLGTLLHKLILLEGVSSDDMVTHVVSMFVEQVELHILALIGKCLREDNIFEFEPILLAPTLLLLHLNISNHPNANSKLIQFANYLFSNNPYQLYYMSNISQSKRIHRFWKISESSKVFPNEPTLNDVSKLLPSKFSPHKSLSKDSKIFNTPKDNPKPHARSPSLTSRESLPLNLSSSKHQITRRQSLPMIDSPDKQRQVASKDSLILKDQLQFHQPLIDIPLLKSKNHFEFNYELLKSQQLVSFQAIYQIKTDFANFKAQVWAELLSQRELIAKTTAQILKKIEQYVPQTKYIEQSLVLPIKPNETADILDKINTKFDIFHIQLDQRCELLTSQRLQPQVPKQQPQEAALQPPEQQSNNNTLNANVSNEADITAKTPIERLNQIYSIPEKRQTPFDRCNHIVQTIGMLNQINSSPISNKAKSIQKLNIQQYKEKLISVSKSNERLMKQSLRGQLVSQPQSRLKGNFKLQKFYNAIEKLKEEVNQIRNINDMNQIKKLNIVKVNQ